MHEHKHLSTPSDDTHISIAVAVNVLLTFAQVTGGVISGSLSLIADALHNLGDAATLGIALFARKIGRRPPNHLKTFGYKRAEVIAALINLTALMIIGIYLIYVAVWRLFQPQEIAGWIVVIVAGIALVVDTVTAILTYRLSRQSLNIRAAFLHNISDALASIGVIIAGSLILLFQWYWIDALITLLIAGYVLYQGYVLLPQTIHILMEGTPEHISVDKIARSMESIGNVESVHHLHIWQLDEHRNALEAHVVIRENDLADMEVIKQRIKKHLHDEYQIEHSTLEMEIGLSRSTVCEDGGSGALHEHPPHRPCL